MSLFLPLLCALCYSVCFYLWFHGIFVFSGLIIFHLACFYLAAKWHVQLGWRRSRFGETIRRWFVKEIDIDDNSRKALREMADRSRSETGERRSYMFCYEPHGAYICFGMAFTAAIHDAQMPPTLTDQLVVVAHRFYLAVPFLNVLYEACGVVPNFSRVVSNALSCGQNVALTPSGLAGKSHALWASNNADIVDMRGKNLAFLALARRYRAFVVPVLSPDEAKLQSNAGWFGVPHSNKMRLIFGKPIDTDLFGGSRLGDLADEFYAALLQLVPAEEKILLNSK